MAQVQCPRTPAGEVLQPLSPFPEWPPSFRPSTFNPPPAAWAISPS